MKHGFLVSLASVLGPAVMHWNTKTLRKQILGREHVDRAVESGGSVIYALWHGRFWLPSALFGFERSALMVSLSKDGDIIAAIAEGLGYVTVRGSSSRGGSDALKQLEEHLRAGKNVAITPDGPRGPKHVAKLGALSLGERTGRAIIPVGAGAHPARHFASWDRFQVPHLFGRACVAFGEPFYIQKEKSIEANAERLTTALIQVQEEADRMVGK